MRLALKLVASSFSLSWGYAPISSLGKSLFYQNLSKNLQKPTTLSLRKIKPSLLNDPRNLSCKWLVLRGYLTPLAAIEKKTISGFDTRLALVKSPWKIKQQRRAPLVGYPVTPEGGRGAKPLLPFISQASGWGVKSSKTLGYLGKTSFLVFKKPTSGLGFLNQERPSATNLLVGSKGLFLSNETEEDKNSLSEDVSFLLKLDTFSESPLLSEKTYLGGKLDSPNLTPETVESQFDVDGLNGAARDALLWISGFLKNQYHTRPTSGVRFYKSYLAKRLVILS